MFRLLGIAIGFLITYPAQAVVEVGERVPNLCYVDVNEYPICLDHIRDSVRVLIYSTGWCPGCKEEMRELVPLVNEFKGKPVQFISLSAQGESSGSLPDTDFLKRWKSNYQIPFVVAGAPRDAGKNFFTPPNRIPNVVIIDKSGVVTAKEVGMSAHEIVSKVRTLLK